MRIAFESIARKPFGQQNFELIAPQIQEMGVEESLRELFKELLIDTKLIAEDKEEIRAL